MESLVAQQNSQPARQTAYKVWMSNLLNSEFVKEEGEWQPNYVLLNEHRVYLHVFVFVQLKLL